MAFGAAASGGHTHPLILPFMAAPNFLRFFRHLLHPRLNKNMSSLCRHFVNGVVDADFHRSKWRRARVLFGTSSKLTFIRTDKQSPPKD
jgi:hypothetical protein